MVSRSSNEALYIAESLFCLGHMYSKLDRVNEAVSVLIEAKDIFASRGHKSRVAQCYMKLSKVYSSIMDIETCYAAAEAARRNLDEIGDESLIADTQLCIGQCHWFSQHHEESRECLIKAQQIYLKLNKPMGVAHCNYWISRTYYGEKMYAEARTAAEAALVEYKRLDHREGVAMTLIHLCRILKTIKHYYVAINRMLEGIRIYQESGGPVGIGEALEILGEIYVDMGAYEEARLVFRQSIETFSPVLGVSLALIGTARSVYGIAQTLRLESRFEDADRADLGYMRIWNTFKEKGFDITAPIIQPPVPRPWSAAQTGQLGLGA